MAVANPPRLMTTEELLAMPDDGVERWLIRGQLREARPTPEGNGMTVRNRDHGAILVGAALANWWRSLPEPRGLLVGGEAGVRLRQTPESTVGIDVAYVGPEVA